MNLNWPMLGIFCSVLISSAYFLQVEAACELEQRQVSECYSEFDSYQNETVWAMKRIFSEQQPCSTRREEKLKEDARAKVDRMERNFKTVISALWKPGNHQDYAHVSQSVVAAKMNTPLQLSCGSGGKPLSLCVWELNKDNGQVEMITIDKQVEANDGGRISKRISTAGRGFSAGQCTIQIRAATSDDLGQWRCSLVTDSGQVLIGEMDVIDELETIDSATDGKIYATTTAGEVRVMSTKTYKVTRIIQQGSDTLYGIAVDTIRNKLYWTSSYKIYRSELNGTGVRTVLDTSNYGTLYGLAFDWISGNVYVASRRGVVLACDGAPGRNFPCATIMTDQGSLNGLALDPSRRTMYLAAGGTITYAAMDGTNPSSTGSGFGAAFGIIVDVRSSTVYLADYSSNVIRSSKLDASEMKSFTTSLGTPPYGIALVEKRLYWGPYNEKRVESKAIAGGDISSFYIGGNGRIQHLTSPDWSLAANQTNPCAGQTCSGVCVLTRTHHRCINLP